MSKHLLIREHGEYVPIAAKAVLRIEGNGNYVNIYLKNGKVFYNQPGSIGDWKKELEKLIFFVKICRSHIVNYHRVVSFSMKNGVLLCLCAAREYEKIIAMPAGEEKANAIKKNTLRLPLNTAGFLDLKILYDIEKGIGSGSAQVA